MFGANEWLVDELYEQYLKDKNAVDPAWWEFFADYRPGDKASEVNGSSATAAAAPAAGTVTPTVATPAPAVQIPANAPATPPARSTSAVPATDGSAAGESAQRPKSPWSPPTRPSTPRSRP